MSNNIIYFYNFRAEIQGTGSRSKVTAIVSLRSSAIAEMARYTIILR